MISKEASTEMLERMHPPQIVGRMRFGRLSLSKILERRRRNNGKA